METHQKAIEAQGEKTSRLVIDLIGVNCVPKVKSLHIQFLWGSGSDLHPDNDGDGTSMEMTTVAPQRTKITLLSQTIKTLSNLSSLRFSGLHMPFNLPPGSGPFNFELDNMGSASVVQELFGGKKWDLSRLINFNISSCILQPLDLIIITEQTSFPNLIKLNIDRNPCVSEESMDKLVKWAECMGKLEELNICYLNPENAQLFINPLSTSTLLTHLKTFIPPPALEKDLNSLYYSKMFSRDNNFTTLYFRGHELDPAVVTQLSKCPTISNVTKLILDGCNGVEDDQIKDLCQSPYLNNVVELTIGGLWSFSDEGFEFITKSSLFSNLTSLVITSCPDLTSSIFKLIAESKTLKNLTTLVINDICCDNETVSTDEDGGDDDDGDFKKFHSFTQSSNLQNVKKLILQGCSFSSQCLKSLFSSPYLTKLESLDLFDNAVDDTYQYTSLLVGGRMNAVDDGGQGGLHHNNPNYKVTTTPSPTPQSTKRLHHPNQCPFPNLRELNLTKCNMNDNDLMNIYSAPFFSHLISLSLAGCPGITDKGILTLCGGTPSTQGLPTGDLTPSIQDHNNKTMKMRDSNAIFKKINYGDNYHHTSSLQRLDLSSNDHLTIESLYYLLTSPQLTANLNGLNLLDTFRKQKQQTQVIIKKFPNGLFL